MERTINKILKPVPTAILTSDWHLREDIPLCRTDNYWEAQWKKIDYISKLQKQYDCIVIHAGDLFDKWKPSPYLLRETIEHIPDQFYTVYGQHDLPAHNLDLVDKCGINVLQAAGKLTVLKGIHWGQVPRSSISMMFGKKFSRPLVVWHKMNYQGRKPWPSCTDPLSVSLLRKYPQFDLIVTGDNHKSFTEEYQGRHLVNPGSLMRMDADQVNHHPCVYLWYAENNQITLKPLPHEPNVISREHIDRVVQHNERINAFVSRVNTDWEAAMSFEDNLEIYKKKNKTPDSIMQIIYNAID
jgi:DNA repair exonuclease SbcCD nuclease subunit